MQIGRRKIVTNTTQSNGHIERDEKQRAGRSPAGQVELRDFFAAHALAGILASQEEGGTYHKGNAEMAYALADAMIKEREKRDDR